MLGRLFGKNKDASDEAICHQCGRTLLAGEWTETVVDDDGEEHLLCSLCGKARPAAGGQRYRAGDGDAEASPAAADDAGPADDAVGSGPRTSQRGTASRGENDALWKAIKDRDAQIERLNEQLARGEAERQELIGRLARLQGAAGEAGATGAAASALEPETGVGGAVVPEAVAPEAVEREAPELQTLEPEAPDAGLAGAAIAEHEAGEPTGERPAADQLPLDEDTAAIPAVEAPDYEDLVAGPEAAAPYEGSGAQDEVAPGAAEVEAQAASMTLLQRGVDLLNVSPVPRKIAETNASLGIPTVHAGFDGETATVTFMWSMGWYRFGVDIESGKVRLDDRGYEDRGDLQPNATVRADGTVHLAAARISRAAAQRQQSEAPAAVEVAEPAETEAREAPTDEPVPPAGGPEILSKSLLGQRTDDERPSWEQTQARDFDWDH